MLCLLGPVFFSLFFFSFFVLFLGFPFLFPFLCPCFHRLSWDVRVHPFHLQQLALSMEKQTHAAFLAPEMVCWLLLVVVVARLGCAPILFAMFLS